MAEEPKPSDKAEAPNQLGAAAKPDASAKPDGELGIPPDAAPEATTAVATEPSKNRLKSLLGGLTQNLKSKLTSKKESGAAGTLREILSALFSRNPRERKMAWLFFISLGGICGVTVWGVRTWIEWRRQAALNETSENAQRLNEFIQKQSAEAKKKQSMLDLGTITIELNPLPGRKRKGIQNLGEMDLVIECDGKDTRDYLGDHQEQVKDVISNALTPYDREDLLRGDGKDKLKRQIQEALNEALTRWIHEGRVEKIYIQRMVLN